LIFPKNRFRSAQSEVEDLTYLPARDFDFFGHEIELIHERFTSIANPSVEFERDDHAHTRTNRRFAGAIVKSRKRLRVSLEALQRSSGGRVSSNVTRPHTEI